MGVRQAVARVFRRRLNYGCNYTRSSVCAGKLASGFLATFRSRNLLFCPRVIFFAAKGTLYAGGFALHRCCLESNLKIQVFFKLTAPDSFPCFTAPDSISWLSVFQLTLSSEDVKTADERVGKSTP